MKKILLYILSIVSLCGVIFLGIYYLTLGDKEGGVLESKKKNPNVKTARVVANGDILCHDALYYTAKKRVMGVMILINFLNMLSRG